jgi:hypothetical protein
VKQKIASHDELADLGVEMVDLPRSTAAASALPENTPAIPSSACFFQALISV